MKDRGRLGVSRSDWEGLVDEAGERATAEEVTELLSLSAEIPPDEAAALVAGALRDGPLTEHDGPDAYVEVDTFGDRLARDCLVEGVIPVRSAVVADGRLGVTVEADTTSHLFFQTGEDLTIQREDAADLTGEVLYVQIEHGVTIWLDTRAAIGEVGA